MSRNPDPNIYIHRARLLANFKGTIIDVGIGTLGYVKFEHGTYWFSETIGFEKSVVVYFTEFEYIDNE
jgi:hypothetical protein